MKFQIFAAEHTAIHYACHAKKRLVKAAMRKARRAARAQGFQVRSVTAFKKEGYGRWTPYYRQYRL